MENHRPIDKLTVAFIRASNYDDDGFIIQYLRGVLPSNTLACMRSLTLEFADRWRTERGIDIKVEVYDEIVDAIPFRRLAGKNRGRRMVVAAVVGVQSNQFARASDIALRLSSLGVKTLVGGFHVSGILAMFKEPTPEITALMDAGVTVVQGEAEGVWEGILSDVVAGREQTLYRMEAYPDISSRPIPRPAPGYMRKFALPDMGTIDCSRGCPFDCSFCTIINVQGRKMRCRSAESVLTAIRENYGEGIRQYFFTDDNFSRNPAWRGVFEGIIRMREEDKLDIGFMMQVDTTCHKIPGFVELAGRAGCTQVFIGMESLNPKNLEAVQKRQNHVEDYGAFIEAWHDAGVMTHVGYIIGFPFDSLESVRRDILTLRDEIKVDQASFFLLTPLPGSRDHYNMVTSGARMDSDLNKFDSFHVLTDHPLMTADEWRQAYQEAWDVFYDNQNLKRVLLRAGKKEYWNIFKNIMWYKNSLLEPRHPMVAGFLRIKRRTEVRPGTPVMSRTSFALMRIRDFWGGLKKRIQLFFELQELWLLTRKPEDPTFRLVADLTTSLTDVRRRIGELDFNQSYARWSEDFGAAVSSLSAKTRSFANTGAVAAKTRMRVNHLMGDLCTTLETLKKGDTYRTGITSLANRITTVSRQIENASLKHVKTRRSMTQFWEITWNRLKRGKVFSFAASTPRILFNTVRDIRLSLSFALHLIFKVR